MHRVIANYAFALHRRDIDSLRTALGRSAIDLPRTFIARMKRKDLVNALLVQRFGTDQVIEYTRRCQEWDRCKDFVEGRQDSI